MSSSLGHLSSQLSETYAAAIQLPRGSFCWTTRYRFWFYLCMLDKNMVQLSWVVFHFYSMAKQNSFFFTENPLNTSKGFIIWKRSLNHVKINEDDYLNFLALLKSPWISTFKRESNPLAYASACNMVKIFNKPMGRTFCLVNPSECANLFLFQTERKP